jgi:2-haloacid dehalogenase
MIDSSRYEVLTFDCYGTLIDWETGILGALAPVLSNHGIELSGAGILRRYAEAEAEIESGPYLPYRDVLSRVVGKLGEVLGFEPTRSEKDGLADSLGTWPPFPETVESLRRLKARFKLGIISNIDRGLFEQSASLMETGFDWVVTAEDARSYKPSHRNFELAISTIGVPADKILHAAESLRHDVVPAKEIGLSVIWVNRSRGRGGQATASGNIDTVMVKADAEVPDMASLAELLLQSSG